jgi:Lrp/AsnC family transcriptional regulator, leucine-responsive regulatory protein
VAAKALAQPAYNNNRIGNSRTPLAPRPSKLTGRSAPFDRNRRNIRVESCAVQSDTQDSADMELDQLDIRILRAVQRNNRLTSDELGEQVGLSPTACQRRLKRLRAERVIEADVSVLSPAGVGRKLLMLVMISLERERSTTIDAFKRVIRETEEIMVGLYVTGETDFALLVTAKDMEDYEAFTRRLFYQMPDIKGFKTMVVMDRIKASLALPLDLPES